MNNTATRIYIYIDNKIKVYDGNLKTLIGELKVDGYSIAKMYLHGRDRRLIFLEGCFSKLRVFNVYKDDFRELQVIYSAQTLRGFVPVSPRIFGYFD